MEQDNKFSNEQKEAQNKKDLGGATPAGKDPASASNHKSPDKNDLNEGKGKIKDKDKKKNPHRQGNGDQGKKKVPKSHGNDPKWYMESEELGNAVASFPWGVPNKTPIQVIPGDATSRIAAPAIATISVLPTFGKSTDFGSALMLAARSIYSYVRHKNSGSKNYEENDLMMYILAVDNLYALYAELVRAYATACTYKLYNWYWARDILSALGYDADDISTNLAQFRAEILKFGLTLGRFSIPIQFNLLKRHAWMFSNIFYEDKVNKSQLIAYVPEGFYAFNSTKYDTGSALEFKGFRHAGESYESVTELHAIMRYKTVADIRNYINNVMIAPIFRDEDIGTMAGDIEKAYGTEAMLRIPAISEVVSIEPVYSEEVLSQFGNSVMLGLPCNQERQDGKYYCDIYQEASGVIINDPRFMTRFDHGDARKHVLLTMYKDKPTPADTMVATRCTVMPDIEVRASVANGFMYPTHSFASEIACVAEYWVSAYDASTNAMQLYHDTVTSFIDTSMPNYSGSLTDASLIMVRISKFAYRPVLYLFSADSAQFLGDFRDWDNWTLRSVEDIKGMHEVAILSLFNIPNQGFWAATKG